MTTFLTPTTALMLLVFLTTICLQRAFLLPGPCSISRSSITPSDITSLSAKKRRRRRKDGAGPSSSAESSSEPEDSNELPDFDLESTDAEGVEPSEKSAMPQISVGDLETVTGNMMGDPNKPTRSVNELLQDRSLESKLALDDSQGDAAIPDFTQLAQASKSTGASLGLDNGVPKPMSEKRQRQAERKAAAIKAAAAEEESDDNPLFELGFIRDEKGKISPIKILETGAWAGIFLLVGWEFYLNSPLFERAAPMAPVVYEMLVRDMQF